MKPSGSAYSNLGTVYFYLARYNDAVQSYEQALKINDRDYRLWKNLAAAYHWAPNQKNQAQEHYRRAAALAEEQRQVNSKNRKLLLDIADCYSMLGETRRAGNLLQQALNPAPDNAGMMFDAGVIYEQLGNRELALEWVGKALRAGYSRDLVERSPSLAQLRTDPRFEKLRNP